MTTLETKPKRVFSEEHRRKIGLANSRRVLSEATKEKIRIAHTGKKMGPMSEQTKLKISLSNKGIPKPISDETRLKLSKSLKGRVFSQEHKSRIGKANTGRVLSDVSRLKISLANKGRFIGEKSHAWRGGITPINEKIRHSSEYKAWRLSVFKRDNYLCVFGCEKTRHIHADHIKQFAYYPELRLDINNGRTLCVSCHRKTPTYGGRKPKLI